MQSRWRWRELAQRVDDVLLIVAERDLVFDRRLIVVAREVMTQRHEAAPVVVAREVEHDRAQIRGCLRGILDAVRRSGRAG